MSTRNRIIILVASLLAFVILLLTAKAISDNTWKTYQPTPVEVPADVKLEYPETEIKAASDAILPTEPKPEVKVESAPVSPANIPPAPPVSTTPYIPFYQAPKAQPQYPLTSPEPPLSQPILPSPVQPLVPEIVRPVEGLLGPLAPVADPLLDTVEEVLSPLPQTIEVGIEPNEPDIEEIQPDQLPSGYGCAGGSGLL